MAPTCYEMLSYHIFILGITVLIYPFSFLFVCFWYADNIAISISISDQSKLTPHDTSISDIDTHSSSLLINMLSVYLSKTVLGLLSAISTLSEIR